VTPRLFLHIGLPKVASTAIQHWCVDHREPLMAAGITYPARRPGSGARHQFVVHDIASNTETPAYCDLFDALETPSLLLSSEGFSKQLPRMQEDALRRFREATARFHVTVLLCVRDANRWTLSYWKQCVVGEHARTHPLGGTAKRLSEFAQDNEVQFLTDLPKIKDLAINGFGAQDCEVFDIEQPDWFDGMRRCLGVLDTPLGQIPLPRLNSSVPIWTAEMARAINALALEQDERRRWMSLLQRIAQTDHPRLSSYPDLVKRDRLGKPTDPGALDTLEDLIDRAVLDAEGEAALASALRKIRIRAKRRRPDRENAAAPQRGAGRG